MTKNILTGDEAFKALKDLAKELAIIHTPENVHTGIQYLIISKKAAVPIEQIDCIIANPDFILYDISELNQYILEKTIRILSEKYETRDWKGLDEKLDIGLINDLDELSAVKKIGYKYSNFIKKNVLLQKVIEAAIGFLSLEQIEEIVEENNIQIYNALSSILSKNEKILNFISQKKFNPPAIQALSFAALKNIREDLFTKQNNFFDEAILLTYLYQKRIILEILKTSNENNFVTNTEYEKILSKIKPTEGLLEFLLLIKGKLSFETAFFANRLLTYIEKKHSPNFQKISFEKAVEILSNLNKIFQNKPAKLALTTEDNRKFAETFFQIALHNEIKKLKSIDLPEDFIQRILSEINNLNFIDNIFTLKQISPNIDNPQIELRKLSVKNIIKHSIPIFNIVAVDSSENGILAFRAADVLYTAYLAPHFKSSFLKDCANANLKGGLPELILETKLFFDLKI